MTHVSRLLFLLSLLAAAVAAAEPQTERQYLSGHGPKDAVPWEFTVTGGRRAGEQTTIPVPSNWEQQGFGTYNYGQEPVPKANEHGLYRLKFAVPQAWKGRRIRLVFDGVMTDATVKVNGRVAGPTHQGAYYRFHYDVTPLVKLGGTPENVLEVDVAKVSANADTESAERGGDYWVFGGIFRPVWLEASPPESIEHTAIDARADGAFTADITLASVRQATRVDGQIFSADGKPMGEPFSARVPAGGTGRVRLRTHLASPRTWTAETPNLYSVRLTLRKGDEVLHTTTERFGFRTFEVRPGDGLYLNGQRILLKGVDRHSFRADTARALNREDCYDDARLIRSMNMNAVRMSHYPPDEAFLEACDELGLYVLDELSGWHHAHDTDVGRRLVRAMVDRDVNHPSVVFWDNGNEGGWNRELDGDFALYDPQHRRVLHPWELHDDVDTKHYPTYEDLTKRLQGPHILMPTEFLHGLYDGGAGAGLEDYWKAISASRFGGGGFIWVFADEGIARTDQGGRIDVFGTYAPDGIVGPRHEKEGSYFTVRDVWDPIQIDAPTLDDKFDGSVAVANRYDFTSLADCAFAWRLVRFPGPWDKESSPLVLAKGDAAAPAIPPHGTGRLVLGLPAQWRAADAVVLTASGPDQQELWTWTWPTHAGAKPAGPVSAKTSAATPRVQQQGGKIQLTAGDVVASFDGTTGLLSNVRVGSKQFGLTHGPLLTFARPGKQGEVAWRPIGSEDLDTQVRPLSSSQVANVVEIVLDYTKSVSWAALKLELSPDGKVWKTIYDGSRREGDGRDFIFPPQTVAAVRVTNVHRSDGEKIAVKSVRIGYAASRFPATSEPHPTVTQGTEREVETGAPVAWIEATGGGGLDRVRWTLRGDGTLKLDYNYKLTGEMLFHGITFSHPDADLKSVRWLGAGPYRVWQNRLRGTWLGVHEIARHATQAGETWNYPESEGYFGGLRWARFETAAGPFSVTSSSPDLYLRVGTPRINHQNTTVEFPAGEVSFLHAIPAMGSKFVAPEHTGPSSEPAKANGTYHGTLLFRFSGGEAARE